MKTRLLTCALAAFAAVAWTAASQAQTPVLDGSLDASYGAALSIQNTNTAFGNGTNGDPINGGGGSEIDGVYARVDGGRLYVFVAGNLETNFNKLEFFFDSKAGGVNSIVGPNSPKGVDPFCCGGFPPPDGNNTNNDGALQRMNGLTFDTGFDADYYLTINHGFEGNIGGSGITAYAATAHYADLTQGSAGVGQALGMQLAQKGLPNVLRGTTADVNVDGSVDGADVLVFQRGLGNTGVNRLQGDANSDGNVSDLDLPVIQGKFGFTAATSSLTDNFFAPQTAGVDNSNVLLGPTIPNLAAGDLIDKTWLAANPGFAAPEVQFAAAVDTPGNTNNHRNMQNTIDLKLAIDNSNTAGVVGNDPYNLPTTDTNGDLRPAGDPQNVTKGIEFSIPLSAIGNPTSGGSIKLFAFINGGGHDYASNQFIGTTSPSDATNGLLTGNLGGNGFGGYTGDLSGVNMLDFLGDQFVSINIPAALAAGGAAPEPAAAILAIVALAGAGALRRRQS
jgi:hypothetical protein